MLLVLLVAAGQEPRGAGPDLALPPADPLERGPGAARRARQAAARLVLAVAVPSPEPLEESGGQPPGVFGARRDASQEGRRRRGGDHGGTRVAGAVRGRGVRAAGRRPPGRCWWRGRTGC